MSMVPQPIHSMHPSLKATEESTLQTLTLRRNSDKARETRSWDIRPVALSALLNDQ